jgi:hypothetical protein
MFALFAGVQVESAFWTLPYGIGEILQKRATFRAAGDGSHPRHVHGARSEGIFFFWSRGFIELFFLVSVFAAGVLVSALAILGIRQ